jgi:hypothetical protein
VKGTLRIRASVRGARTVGIGLYVDGHVVSRDRSAPYAMRWNSHRVHDGRHWRPSLRQPDRQRQLPLVVATTRSEESRRPATASRSRPHPKPKPHPRPAEATREATSAAWVANRISPTADGQRYRRLAGPPRAGRTGRVRGRQNGDRDVDDRAVGDDVGLLCCRTGRAHPRAPRLHERRPTRRPDDQRHFDVVGSKPRSSFRSSVFS